MGNRKLEDLRENLCEELEKVSKREGMNTADLDVIDKLTHAIKNLDKVMLGNEMIEEYGYSFGSYNRGYSGARRGRDGDGDGRYNESRGRSYENNYESYARGRSRDGSLDNYNRNSNGYSGHYDEQSIERFKHMMQDAIHEL